MDVVKSGSKRRRGNKNPDTTGFSGQNNPGAYKQLEEPSFLRTVPSTPEFHRVMRGKRSWVITTDRELGENLPHPAPKAFV
jgi:hypothetical protein